MSYNASVKFQYVNDSEPSSSKLYREMLDQQTITMEAPAQDMNVFQYYEMFKGFLRAIGFQEYSILEGACSLAFNDSNDEELMKKLMKEYGLQDSQVHSDDDYYALQEKYEELKNSVDITKSTEYNSPHQNASHYNSTYDQMISSGYEMTADGFWIPKSSDNAMKPWNNLIPGSDEAVAKGCKCPIMDNAEMPKDRKWVNADCPLHGRVKVK